MIPVMNKKLYIIRWDDSDVMMRSSEIIVMATSPEEAIAKVKADGTHYIPEPQWDTIEEIPDGIWVDMGH